MAAQENHVPVVKYLLDRNANPALATEVTCLNAHWVIYWLDTWPSFVDGFVTSMVTSWV